VGASPREGAAVEMGLAVVARCGSAVRQWRAVVARWCGEAGSGLFIAGVRRFGEIFPAGLAGEGGALAGPWWPAGIPVAGRQHGSCRVMRRLGRGGG
jgi:hypothetical protein